MLAYWIDFCSFFFPVKNVRISGNDRKKNLENFYFLHESYSKVYNRQKECRKIFQSPVHHAWAAKKSLISRTCKATISSFWEFIIFTEKTLERKGQAVNCEFSEEYSPVM